MSEDQLQAEMFKWVWNTYPQLRHHIWAVPNGAVLDIRTAQKMKATGLLSGVWDLHMFWRSHFYVFEQKVGKNQLTRDRLSKSGARIYGQLEWGERMRAHGATTYIIRTLEQFQFIIVEILVKYP